MQGAFIYALSIGICAGIASALLCGFGVVLAGFCVAGAVLLLLAGKRHAKIVALSIFLCATAVGLLRTDVFLQKEQSETVSQYVGQTVVVAGVVASDPDKRDTSLHVTIAIQKINNEVASGEVLAMLPRETPLSYGDTITVRGALLAPRSFVGDTGHEFNYPAYLRVQGVSALIPHAVLEKQMSGGWSLNKILFAIKHFFEQSLERLFPEPDVSLLEGVLLGERHGIPRDLTQAFVVSGLVHIVVLSGYNISVVSDATMRLFSFLPRTLGVSFGIVTMLLFALMTGAGATTVRASAMGLIAILARYAHRPSIAMRSLAAAGAGMALWNPPALLFDPSFILSMLATFGLITFSSATEKKLRFITERAGLRSIAASTIAVQIFVLPALLYFTGVLSFVSLPANMLALPTVPFAMLGGFFSGLLGMIHPVLAFPFTLVGDALLRYLMLVANVATALPFASAIIPPFSAWLVVIFYVPLTWFALRLYRMEAKQI